MTTKSPSEINFLNDDNPLKRIYTILDELSEVLPVRNERYRLSYYLNLYNEEKIKSIREAIDIAKLGHCKISDDELEKIVVKKFKDNEIQK